MEVIFRLIRFAQPSENTLAIIMAAPGGTAKSDAVKSDATTVKEGWLQKRGIY